MEIRKTIYAALFLACLSGFAFSITPVNPTSQLQNALSQLCQGLNTLVPVAAMLMVLLAAVIYATGQMMGAETRARANVWATSCLTGALIGILISVIAPAVLTTISGSTISC
ncbi:Uncharacterised protein [uncultured archaeon]|nr:Uncharacterised protein [uncultured archaeon]